MFGLSLVRPKNGAESAERHTDPDRWGQGFSRKMGSPTSNERADAITRNRFNLVRSRCQSRMVTRVTVSLAVLAAALVLATPAQATVRMVSFTRVVEPNDYARLGSRHAASALHDHRHLFDGRVVRARPACETRRRDRVALEGRLDNEPRPLAGAGRLRIEREARNEPKRRYRR